MSFYDAPAWQAQQGPARQSSWDQPQPPSRSGASSVTSREEAAAFGPQFEEVERAYDNLTKSGKIFPGPRRDMGPGAFNRQYSDFDPRAMGGPSSRHSSMDFDPMRSQSASNLQSFYASARYQPRGGGGGGGGGSGDADQMQQAKRRMAAQRERELRNYHQEQQYNRSIFSQSNKSDRSISPNAMNDEERRDLIARQHRALYGAEGSAASPSSSSAAGAAGPPYFDGGSAGPDTQTPRPGHTGPGSAGGPRGPSPLTYNAFGVPEGQQQQPQQPPPQSQSAAGGVEDAAKGPSPGASGRHSRTNSASSPAPFPGAGAQGQQPPSHTSASSPGGSPPPGLAARGAKAGAPAPIGTRPVHPALSKRATPPANSPLSYGFAPGEAGPGAGAGASGAPEPRAGSAASNPSGAPAPGQAGLKENVPGWGSGSGVWGKGNIGSVQASVWG